MIRRLRACAAVAGCALLVACGGAAATQANVAAVDPVASSTLQFAVGIATFSRNGGASVSHGLNVVETLRQPDGLSALLYDVPSITGPTTFTISTSTIGNQPLSSNTTATMGGGGGTDAGADYGTNRITQATLNDGEYIGFVSGPLAVGHPSVYPTAGAFGYGLCACNANAAPQTGVASLYVAYSLPIYGGTGALQYYGGPPAFPASSPEVAQQGFAGYSIGFADFAVAPVLGAYRLDVAVPPAFQTPATATAATLSATAQLTSLRGLPPYATPSFSADGNGGGTIGVTIPAGSSESLVFVEALGVDTSVTSASDTCASAHGYAQFYTILVSGSGTRSIRLADALGPPDAQGNPSRSLCSQEQFSVYAAGFDYPAYESAYPQNLAVTPTISSAAGQADITTSDALTGTYP